MRTFPDTANNIEHSRKYALYFLVSLLALLVLMLSGCGKVQQPDISSEKNKYVKITGCYSNLHYHDESGDLLGWEFIIVYAGDGYHVLFQESEGVPTVLLLLPVTVNGNTIRFTIPRNYGNTQFEGVVTADRLTGTFSNYPLEIVLERKKSYWQ
ncbi:MAG: hypothetical protein LBL45_13310 [Treponema sp.]|jgi:hypothetical protein|nr:hypothetical protein [Treponema sp.]